MLHKRAIFINSDKQWITNSQGFQLRITPSFFVGDNLLLCFTIKDNNGSALNLTGYTFKAGFDYSFITGHTDLVISANDQFNISGDWDETDITNGKISCRLNCTPTLFSTYMTDYAFNKTGYFDLWAIPTVGTSTLLTQFKVDLKNPIANPINYDVGGIGYMVIGSTFRIG